MTEDLQSLLKQSAARLTGWLSENMRCGGDGWEPNPSQPPQ